MVDVQERLDELTVMVEDAKSMPLSASCVLNRSQLLDIIEEIRQLLPESVYRADELLADREAVVLDGRREADRILEQARAQADRMVSEHEVYLAAVAESNALREEPTKPLRLSVKRPMTTSMRNWPHLKLLCKRLCKPLIVGESDCVARPTKNWPPQARPTNRVSSLTAKQFRALNVE
jgi:hypothetical protein